MSTSVHDTQQSVRFSSAYAIISAWLSIYQHNIAAINTKSLNAEHARYALIMKDALCSQSRVCSLPLRHIVSEFIGNAPSLVDNILLSNDCKFIDTPFTRA
jgi:hypothetical protein